MKSSVTVRKGILYEMMAPNSPELYLGDDLRDECPPSNWRNYKPLIEKVNEFKNISNSQEKLIITMARWIVANKKYRDHKKFRTVEETFLRKSGICCDSALLMASMTRLAGIPCRIVFSREPNGSPHALNQVYLNNKWSCIDATPGDDEVEFSKCSYFLLTPIKRNGEWSVCYVKDENPNYGTVIFLFPAFHLPSLPEKIRSCISHSQYNYKHWLVGIRLRLELEYKKKKYISPIALPCYYEDKPNTLGQYFKVELPSFKNPADKYHLDFGLKEFKSFWKLPLTPVATCTFTTEPDTPVIITPDKLQPMGIGCKDRRFFRYFLGELDEIQKPKEVIQTKT